jgi:phage baseplate assembly protein V
MRDSILKLLSRLNGVFQKGKATIIRNDLPIQVQQISMNARQIRSDIYAPQQYGTESAPHVGSDIIALFKGGSMENGSVIMSYDPSAKPTDLSEGDMMNYTKRNNEEGKVHRIWLKELDGKILIETDEMVQVICKNADIQIAETATVACPNTTWTGNITLNGNITQTGAISVTGGLTTPADVVAGTISLKTHKHPGDGGTGSGPDTGAPIP